MTYPLAPRHPISTLQITRAESLRLRVPQAASIIRAIEDQVKPFSFGTTDFDLNRRYLFSSPEDVKAFFITYLTQQHGPNFSTGLLKQYMNQTLNRSNLSMAEDRPPWDLFRDAAQLFIDKIHERRSLGKNYLRIILGPTGAGKTAFSKGLITAAIDKFWAARLIPSRVEYSRFFTNRSPAPEGTIRRIVRQCQARDALIWYFFSGIPSHGILDLPGMSSWEDDDIKRRLSALEAAAKREGSKLGSQCTLRVASELWLQHVNYLDADRSSKLLGIILGTYPNGFLVSFDGFDIVGIEDFLIDEAPPAPIDPVVKLLGGVLREIVVESPLPRELDCHYLLYLRDTTFQRLRLELDRDVGGANTIEKLWIVPPNYALLAESISKLVSATIDENRASQALEVFARDVADSIRRHILSACSGLDASVPLSSVFGWNGRSMKKHIARIFYWSLERLTNDEEFSTRLRRAGIGPKDLLVELIARRLVTEMPGYQVAEELYLDETRQLRPRVLLSSNTITGLIEKSDLRQAIAHLQDFGETIGFTECIFNYALKDVLRHSGPVKDGQYVPALLLPVRVCQYVDHRSTHHEGLSGSCRMSEIASFLESLGYRVSPAKVEFVIYLLLRAEIIAWKNGEGIRTFHDAQFYTTVFGRILVRRIMTSVSYISEALCISELPVNGLAAQLAGRNFQSNLAWIVDCSFNAILGLNIIRDIEGCEREFYNASNIKDAHIKFDDVVLYENLKNGIEAEVLRILSSKSVGIVERRRALEQKLSNLARVTPGFEPVLALP